MRSVWAVVVAAVFAVGCGGEDGGPGLTPRVLVDPPDPTATVTDQVRILRGVEFVHERGAVYVPGDRGSLVVRTVDGVTVSDVPFNAGAPGEFTVGAPTFGRLMVSVARPRGGVPTHVVLDPTQATVDLREVATGRPDAIFAAPGTRLRVTWAGTPTGGFETAIASPSAGLESPLSQGRLPSGTETIDLSQLQPPAMLPTATDTLWVTSFGGTRAKNGANELASTWLETAAMVSGIATRNGAETPVTIPFNVTAPMRNVGVALDTDAFLSAASGSVTNGTLGFVNVLWYAQAFRDDVPMLLDLGDLFVVNERIPPTMRIGNPFPATWPLARVTVLTVKGADGRFAYFYEAERPTFTTRARTAPRTQPPRNVSLEVSGGVPLVTWEAPATAPDYYIVHLRDAATDETLARWMTRDTRATLAPFTFVSGQAYTVRVSAIRRPGEVDAWSTPLMDARQNLSRADAPELPLTVP